uniref:ATP synthase complex subunit 8 n=1 Tax=Trichina bilobata TaxID=2484568 RepID=A0A7G7CDJ2_9MUSC|nr:ATP synthase F0 subunit 8 [Trichina bilobata]
MPQMAPISWLNLFIIFTLTFILFCIMNYYSFLPSSPQSNKLNNSLTQTSLNWKW